MHAGHYSSLLPEVFRHKTTRVRIFQPQAILIDFHGTISERRWEDKIIFPYVKQALKGYLKDNWTNDTVSKCIPNLRYESFEQRFRHKYDDAPIINDQVEGEEMDIAQLIDQLSDFLLWQISTKRETKETQIIERLVWVDGFQRHQIKTPLYDDVMPSIKLWHDKYSCSIYIISSIDGDTLKLLFSNTDKGDLDKFINGYVGSKKAGDKLISSTYKQFYEKLTLHHHHHHHNTTTTASIVHKSPASSKISSPKEESSRSLSGGKSSKQQPLDIVDSQVVKSPPVKASNKALTGGATSPISSVHQSASDLTGRPVLFLTDSGQEAKAASQVSNGTAFECLLVNRPGNKRIRTYYLSQFQYVDKFDDIEFVATVNVNHVIASGASETTDNGHKTTNKS